MPVKSRIESKNETRKLVMEFSGSELAEISELSRLLEENSDQDNSETLKKLSEAEILEISVRVGIKFLLESTKEKAAGKKK